MWIFFQTPEKTCLELALASHCSRDSFQALLHLWSEPGAKQCSVLSACLAWNQAQSAPIWARLQGWAMWCREPPALPAVALTLSCTSSLPNSSCWQAAFTSLQVEWGWYGSGGMQCYTGTSKCWGLQSGVSPPCKDVLITSKGKSAALLSNSAWERHPLFKRVVSDERNWSTKIQYFPFS